MAVYRNHSITPEGQVKTSPTSVVSSRFRLCCPTLPGSYSDAESEGGNGNMAILRYSEPGSLEQALADLNKTHAIVRVGGKTRVLRETYDGVMGWEKTEYSSIKDFQLFHAKTKFRIPEGKGSILVELGNEWIKWDDRRQFEGVIFDPSEQTPPNVFNLWRGFNVQPRKGDCSLYREHMLNNICNGDRDVFDYLLAWMAQGVQDPLTIPGTAIVLKSDDRGTGKSFFTDHYKKLFGRHGKSVFNPMHLFGRFNDHLEDTIPLVLEEGFFNGNKYQESNLKALITEPTIPIEAKQLPLRHVKNYLRLFILSNEEWVVPAGKNERRFLVLEVNPRRLKDTEYFGRLDAQMKNGGLSALLYDLLALDYSGIDIRNAPDTAALTEQKIQSLNAKQRWWYERLCDGELIPGSGNSWGEVGKDALLDSFAEIMKASRFARERRGSATELGIFLEKMVPGLRESRPRETALGTRRRMLGFPPLEVCREAFEKSQGSKFPWPKTEESNLRVVVPFREGAGS